MRLDGKVAVVTGAGSGIGKGIALTFAKEGADIVVVDIDMEMANTVAYEVKALGRQTIVVKTDVSKYDEVTQMVKTTLKRFGKIDILVNSAGIAEIVPTEELTLDHWNRMVNINLSGVFFCSQAVGKEMIKRRSGKIINISSLSGVAAQPNSIHYVATKHGVIGITKSLAIDWAKYNIKVNCICPGITETPMVKKAMEKDTKMMAERIKRIPLGRIAQPEDHAKAAVFFASSESDYITGQAIEVDGGMYALSSGFTISKA